MSPQNTIQNYDSELHASQDLILPDTGPSQLPDLYGIGYDDGTGVGDASNDNDYSNIRNSGNGTKSDLGWSLPPHNEGEYALTGIYMPTKAQAEAQHVEDNKADQSTFASLAMTTQPQEATTAGATPEDQKQNIFDISTEAHDALMGFGSDNKLGTSNFDGGHSPDITDPEILSLLAMSATEGRTNNAQSHNGNEDNCNSQVQGKAQIEEEQEQDQNQDQGNPPFGFYSAVDWYGDSEDGLF